MAGRVTSIDKEGYVGLNLSAKFAKSNGGRGD